MVDLFQRIYDGAADSFHLLFEAVHTGDSQDVGKAQENDGQADERRKRHRSDVQVLEADEAQHGTGDAQDQDDPPLREADLLVVEALDGDDHTLDHDPEGEDHGKGHCGSQDVEQEEAAEENVEHGAQHPGAAVGQEGLRLEGKDHLGDTGDKGKAAENPRSGKEGDVGLADAKDAQHDQQNARHAEPDFSAFFHRLRFY